MSNPYIQQLADQIGASYSEARAMCKPHIITDEEARRRGYDNASAYEEALHDFLNGC